MSYKELTDSGQHVPDARSLDGQVEAPLGKAARTLLNWLLASSTGRRFRVSGTSLATLLVLSTFFWTTEKMVYIKTILFLILITIRSKHILMVQLLHPILIQDLVSNDKLEGTRVTGIYVVLLVALIWMEIRSWLKTFWSSSKKSYIFNFVIKWSEDGWYIEIHQQ